MVNFETLYNELKRDEGYRQKPYPDKRGKLTIGYGRNLDDVGLSKEESQFLMENDVSQAIVNLRKKYDWFDKLSPARKRAIINMAFNLGMGGFGGFKKMIRAIETDYFKLAAQEAMDSLWAKQVGVRALRISTMISTGEDYG